MVSSVSSTSSSSPGAVLITGTTSGVGLNATKALIDRGWTVVTANRDPIRAAEAAMELAKDGISAEVIDLRTVLPLDIETIAASVKKTNRVLVTCEAPRTGSFGTTIVTEIVRASFDDLDAPVQLVAAANTPVPFATELEEAHLPTTAKVVAAARALLTY